MGESVTFQLGLGGFTANYTDKVCFLEKIDKKQLATGWVRVGCDGVWCTKVCTTGSISIKAVGLAAACIMCFRLVYCNASTRGVIWTGMEYIIQETRLFFWFKYKRSSAKCRWFPVPSRAGFLFLCLGNHWCSPHPLAPIYSNLFLTVRLSQAA